MKKPALRNNRYLKKEFTETKWTKSSKSLGEYIFRRLSLDQSDKVKAHSSQKELTFLVLIR